MIVFTAGGKILPHGANLDYFAPNLIANFQAAQIRGLNAAKTKTEGTP